MQPGRNPTPTVNILWPTLINTPMQKRPMVQQLGMHTLLWTSYMALRLTCTHSDGWYNNKPAIDTYMLPMQRPRPPKQAHTCVQGGRLPCHSLGAWCPIRNPHRRTAMRPSSHSHKLGRVVAARQHEVSRQHVSSRAAEAGSRRRLDNKQAHTRTLSSHQFGWLCPTSSHAGPAHTAHNQLLHSLRPDERGAV